MSKRELIRIRALAHPLFAAIFNPIISIIIPTLITTCAAGAAPLGTATIVHTGYGASDKLRVWGGGLYGTYVRGGVYTLNKTNSTGEGNYWPNGPLGGFCIELSEPATICLLGLGVLSLVRRKK